MQKKSTLQYCTKEGVVGFFFKTSDYFIIGYILTHRKKGRNERPKRNSHMLT